MIILDYDVISSRTAIEQSPCDPVRYVALTMPIVSIRAQRNDRSIGGQDIKNDWEG